MTFREYITEAREWLSTWSGRLALLAASLTGVLASDPSVAIVATEILPDGPIRIAAIIALVSVTYILPMLAQKKDKANDDQA